MKLSRVAVLIFVLVLVCLPAAFADPIDPRIILGGDPCPVSVPGLNFQFTSIRGGGFFEFINNSTLLWTSLSITVNQPYIPPVGTTPGRLADQHGDYVAEALEFFDTVIWFTDNTNHSVTFVFSGGSGIGGHWEGTGDCIHWVGDGFGIDLDSRGDYGVPARPWGDWKDQNGQNLTFNAVASVPEPSTLLLLSFGLIAISSQPIWKRLINRKIQ